jgi:membrane protease YdiL (CAAX protease family)
MNGPYQTPMALVREPLMAFFWVILAPALFLSGAALIALEIIPGFEPGTQSEIDAYHTLWLISCLGTALWFILMSLWSEKISAGPFAGEMRTTANWLGGALATGPLLLIVPTVLVSSFMSEAGWQYREEVNDAVFAPQNWSLAYVFIAVLMAPVVEEVAFRGIAFGAIISRGFSPIAAVTVSSLAFAFSHMQYSPAAMFVVFLSGLGFAVLRLMSGTVIVPIIAHMAANASVLLINWFAANPPT